MQGYFVWAYKVIEGLRGTNKNLEDKLDELFEGQITIEDQTFPVLPPKDQIDHYLEDYYRLLDETKET